MVHRKVEHQHGANVAAVLKDVVGQFFADLAAKAQIYGAIQAVAKVVSMHDEGMASLDGRLGEQTRVRLDDHRLHIGAINHVRTGVGDLGRSQLKLAEHVDTQDNAT